MFYSNTDGDDVYFRDGQKAMTSRKKLLVASLTIGVVGLGLYLYSQCFGGIGPVNDDAIVDSKGVIWRRMKNADLFQGFEQVELSEANGTSNELFEMRNIIPHNFWTAETQPGLSKLYGLAPGHDFFVLKSKLNGKFLRQHIDSDINEHQRYNVHATSDYVGPDEKFKIIPSYNDTVTIQTSNGSALSCNWYEKEIESKRYYEYDIIANQFRIYVADSVPNNSSNNTYTDPEIAIMFNWWGSFISNDIENDVVQCSPWLKAPSDESIWTGWY